MNQVKLRGKTSIHIYIKMFYLLTVADKQKNHKQIWGNITEINIYKKQILQEAGSIQYNACNQHGSGDLLLLLTKIFFKNCATKSPPAFDNLIFPVHSIPCTYLLTWRKVYFGHVSISYLIHDIETVRIHRSKFHHPYSLPCWFFLCNKFRNCSFFVTLASQYMYRAGLWQGTFTF